MDHHMLWIWTVYPLLRNAVCNWTPSILACSLTNLLEYVESCDSFPLPVSIATAQCLHLLLCEAASKLEKVQNETPSSLSMK